MKTYQINKEFNSLEECIEWEDKNLPNRTYNGEPILMVNHTSDINSGKVVLESITTC